MKNKVIIDLFCGGGGTSQGIHWAMENLDIKAKIFAVNHWERAIETHSLNFPKDEAICQSIQNVIPTDLVKQRDVELLWASPECTHFSVARGGKPMDDQSRCTPWDILRWLDMLNVKRLMIENVPEFQTWGPLDETNRPIASEKGTMFQQFISFIRNMGYLVEYRIVNAADYGAPTNRRRLIIQAVKKGVEKSIVWPKRTHGYCTDKEYKTASDIIDWSIPTELIDNRKKPLCENTMKRILYGIEKYWGENAKPFIARYNGGVNRVHSISEPLPVLDTSNRYGLVEPLIMEYYKNGKCRPSSNPLGVVTTRPRFALVEGKEFGLGFRMLEPHELAAAQSFPKDYKFAGSKVEIVKQIGNAVCPVVSEALVKQAFKEAI